MTTLTARMFGQPGDPDRQRRGLREQLAHGVLGDQSETSHGYAASSRTQRPTFAFPPLSPERAPASVPSGRRRVGPGIAGRGIGAGTGLEGPGDRWRIDPLDRAVVVHDLVRGDRLGHETGGEHAVGLGAARGSGAEEARVRGQRHLDRGIAERPSRHLLVRVPGDHGEQGGRLLLGGRVRGVEPGQGPGDLGRCGGAGGLELAAEQLGLGLDVQTGQHDRELVAVAADRGARDLEVRRWRLAAYPGDPHPVRTVLPQRHRVEAGGDVRAGVARVVHLVHQLGGDRADGDRPAGPGCLVMTLEPSRWISAIGKPGRVRSAISVKNG